MRCMLAAVRVSARLGNEQITRKKLSGHLYQFNIGPSLRSSKVVVVSKSNFVIRFLILSSGKQEVVYSK